MVPDMRFPPTGTPVEGDTTVLRAPGAWAPPTLPTSATTTTTSSYGDGAWRWWCGSWGAELDAQPLRLGRRYLFLGREELSSDEVIPGPLAGEGGLRRVVWRVIGPVVEVPHVSVWVRKGERLIGVFGPCWCCSTVYVQIERKREVNRLQLFSVLYVKERERWRVYVCEERERGGEERDKTTKVGLVTWYYDLKN
jgi:hypothetical protein